MYKISLNFKYLKGLENYCEDLDKQFDIALKNTLIKASYKAVKYAKENTTVGSYEPYKIKGKLIKTGLVGGQLRNSWTHSKIIGGNGSYKSTVFNPIEYAQYYEYGHRQTPGRYVPQIGKTLKSPFVKGRYPLKKSMNKIESEIRKILEYEVSEVCK